MKVETKPKTIHYRRATFLQGNNDLQSVMIKTLVITSQFRAIQK